MTKTYILKKDQQKRIVIEESGDYLVKLVGEGAEVKIIGGFSLKEADQLTVNVTTIHEARNTTANTILKAVVDDKARAEINGMIIVRPGAQNTNSFLTERILLLSDKAQAHAIPNLEIEANEVKCSHAATVGKIDEEQVFYLGSRGIPEKMAKEMIAEGFLEEVG